MTEYEADIKKLILARLETMPEYIQINLGNLGTLGKEELMNHVKKGDDFGKKFIEVQMKYLRTFKQGL
ncbi:hypothetical protein HY489_05665 [Candidatus Woesearchaeota archaeon]|nr:hypothetical protein [Candidatus Woesearchaeota archaeon]